MSRGKLMIFIVFIILILALAAVCLFYLIQYRPTLAPTQKTQSQKEDNQKSVIEDNRPYVIASQATSTGRLIINQDFINVAPTEVKAILALYGYTYGNDCEWDGGYLALENNLKCSLNFALGLGYQCSSDQINFLNTYFTSNPLQDNIAISQNNCALSPDTSTVQNPLLKLTLIKTGEDAYRLDSLVNYLNAQEGLSDQSVDSYAFQLENGQFTVRDLNN